MIAKVIALTITTGAVTTCVHTLPWRGRGCLRALQCTSCFVIGDLVAVSVYAPVISEAR